MKNKSTIIILSSSIVAVLFAIGVFIFMFKAIQNKNTHTSKVFETLQDKMAEKENMTVIDKKIDEIETTRKLLREYFIDSKKIDVFVEYLEKLGTDTSTDLSVKSLDVSSVDKNKISFKLLVKGTFTNIMQVISLLENAPYQINITQVSLNKELQEAPPVVDPKNKNPKVPIIAPPILWRVDITFNILKL